MLNNSHLKYTFSLLIIILSAIFIPMCSSCDRGDTFVCEEITGISFDTLTQIISEESIERLPVDYLGSSYPYPIGKYLVLLNPGKKDGFLTVYDTTDYKPVANLITKGRGPNEALTVKFIKQIDRTNHSMWIMGFPFFMGNMDLYKSVETGTPQYLEKVTFDKGNFGFALNSDQTYFIGNNILMGTSVKREIHKFLDNPNCYYVNYDNASRSTIGDTLYIGNYKVDEKTPQYLMTSVWEHTKPDMTKSAVVYSFLNCLHIVNHENGSVRIITSEDKIPNPRDLSINNDSRRSGMCASDDYIFVLCSNSQGNDVNSYFDIYDWDGNPVRRVMLPLIVSTPEYDPDTKQLYCSAIHDNEDYILRFKIDF